MPISASKFQRTVSGIARGGASGTGLLLNADTIKLALYTAGTAPSASSDLVYAATLTGGATEVGSGNGYTTGGNTCGAGITSNSTGTETLRTTSNPTAWTAATSGFSMRYFILYDSTASSALANLLMYWDYGSTLTLSGANGDTLTVTGPATSYATLA
jgi:hypothetical protein